MAHYCGRQVVHPKQEADIARPKGSRNRAKGGDGEDRTITRHDNLSREPLTDEELEALTNSHVTQYEKFLGRKKLADSEFKDICKKAKADGIHLADIKAYIDAKSEEGQEKLRADAERIARMARWFKFATQADLFETDNSPPVQNRSYRLGKEAGLAGEKQAVPTDCDNDTWVAGWKAGQAEMASGGIKQLVDEDEFN